MLETRASVLNINATMLTYKKDIYHANSSRTDIENMEEGGENKLKSLVRVQNLFEKFHSFLLDPQFQIPRVEVLIPENYGMTVHAFEKKYKFIFAPLKFEEKFIAQIEICRLDERDLITSAFPLVYIDVSGNFYLNNDFGRALALFDWNESLLILKHLLEPIMPTETPIELNSQGQI